MGLFNNENGIFLLQDETTLKIGLRTFTSGVAVDTEIAQDSWNIDKLDGTGNSGITLDQTKTLIFFSDFEWLGVGTVRYGFFIDGIPYYCHAIHNSNVNTVVYMSTPNLPLRYEIENDGTQIVGTPALNPALDVLLDNATETVSIAGIDASINYSITSDSASGLLKTSVDRYELEFNGEKIMIPVELLKSGSNKKILCKCDKCGLEKEIVFKNYIRYNNDWGVYFCRKCSEHKRKKTLKENKGVEYPIQSKEINDKIKNTIKEKYGVENVRNIKKYKP